MASPEAGTELPNVLQGTRFLTWFYAVVATLGITAIVVGIALGAWGAVVWGGLMLLLFLLGYVLGRQAFLHKRLTSHSLIVPRPLRGRRSIPLAEISGVGLRYSSAGRSSGWYLKLWTDATAKTLNLSGPLRYRVPGDRHVFQRTSGYVLAMDSTFLAGTPAGRVATTIFERACEVQGPNGPLITHAYQVTAPSRGGLHTAYWSPDGPCGPLPGT